MANRWERGKLGPYTLPQDFTQGGVALAGINNVKGATEKFLVPPGTLFYVTTTTVLQSDFQNDVYVVPSGQSLSRTNYSSLFALCGTVFGSGDGSSTFSLPRLQKLHARVQGTSAASGVFVFQASTIPEHTHLCTRISGVNTAAQKTLTLFDFAPNISPVNTRQNITLFNDYRRNYLDLVGVHVAGSNYNVNIEGQRTSYEYRLIPSWTTTTTELPIGAIVPFIGSDNLSALGSNWLLCNGQTVSSISYPSAAAKGLTVTPDLRGYFVSASATTEVIARTSTSSYAYHNHIATDSGNLCLTPALPSGTYAGFVYPGSSGGGSIGVPYSLASTSTGLGPGAESRPPNVTVNYFMRVN